MTLSVISAKSVMLGALIFSPSLLATTIDVAKLDSAPQVDGVDSEWADIRATRIALKNDKPGGKTTVDQLSVKAAIVGDRLYLRMEWSDSSEDAQHKPFVWDSGKNKYVAGPQREDRMALQFAISGDYSTDWMSGNTFTADMWHWKAARTNPAGLAHDKQTIIGKEAVKRSFKTTAKDGSTIYIQRPSDAGDKLYKTARYKAKVGDVMPKYLMNDQASGSITDVQAKGIWKDGKWVLEISRKLDTGNPDDVRFTLGGSVLAGIAVFDHSGDDDHSHSDMLTFQF